MPNTIIERSYFIFLLFLPLIYYPGIFDVVLIPRQIYLTLFIGLILGLLGYKRKLQLQTIINSPTYLAIFLFLIIAFLSFYESILISQSHYILSKQLILFSFFFLTTLLLHNNILRADYLIKCCVAFGLIAISTALVQIIEKTLRGQNLFHQIEFIAGGFGNKNLLSSILFLSLPFFLIGLNSIKNVKLISLICFLSALSIIIIMRTRIVVIASAFYLLFLLYHYLIIHFKTTKRLILSISICLISAAALVYKLFLEKIVHNLSSSHHAPTQYFYRLFDSQTLKTRIIFWQNSITMFKEHPILGVGVGNFQLHFPKYGLDKFVDPLIINGQNTLQSPHNDFIGLLCETGILGLLAYSIIYLTILFQLRSLIKNAETTNQKWKFIYILGAVIGYLIISLFDFPMERIEHQILLMLLFSITVTSYYKSCKPDTTANNKNYIIIIFLTLSVLYSALISAFRINGEIQTAKMKAANENKRWPQTILYANRATSYFYQLDATGIPVDWYKGIAYFHKKELTQSETYLQNAYRQAPYQLQVINSLASCYETNGQRQKAIALYSKALKISPRFEESRLNLAAIYYNSANFQKAFQTIDKIDFHSTNRRYHAFLLPILSKEINRILSSKADRQTAKKFATNINTPQKLLTLYFDSKRNNTTFEQYILKP